MSAVADTGACEAIIEILGHDRLLYGSDFPVSHLAAAAWRSATVLVALRRYVGLADRLVSAAAPVFVGLESLAR